MSCKLDVIHSVLESHFNICAVFNKVSLGSIGEDNGEILVDHLLEVFFRFDFSNLFEHLISVQVARF